MFAVTTGGDISLSRFDAYLSYGVSNPFKREWLDDEVVRRFYEDEKLFVLFNDKESADFFVTYRKFPSNFDETTLIIAGSDKTESFTSLLNEGTTQSNQTETEEEAQTSTEAADETQVSTETEEETQVSTETEEETQASTETEESSTQEDAAPIVNLRAKRPRR